MNNKRTISPHSPVQFFCTVSTAFDVLSDIKKEIISGAGAVTQRGKVSAMPVLV